MFDDIRIATYMSWLRIRSEHSALKLGFFWEIISLSFIVTFLSLVWGKVLDSGEFQGYYFYVLHGFAVWSLMSRCVDQCSSMKARLYGNLLRGGVSIPVCALADVFYAFQNFLIIFPLTIVASSIFLGVSLLGILYAMLAIVSILVTAFAVMLSLGLIGILYEDVGKLIRTVMRVAFLMTPILWYPEMLGSELLDLLYLNPFYCYLDVYRTGLLSGEVNIISLITMFGQTAFLSAIASFVLKTYSSKVLTELFLEKHA